MKGGASRLIRDDSWYYDSLNKKAFIAGGYMLAAGTKRAAFELWNPAASGVKLLCHGFHASKTGAGFELMFIRSHNAVLTTVISNSNKYLGEAAPLGVFYSGEQAAFFGDQIGEFGLNDTVPIDFNFVDPIVIDEGLGLVIQMNTNDLGLICTVQWTEI